MTITYHDEIEQGSDEWLQLRCGLLTASTMKHAVSKKTDRATKEVTWVVPDAEKDLAHVNELAAQRVTEYVEPSYLGDDMLRGLNDETEAKILYNEKISKVKNIGFITNDKWGFTLGYSPDGLVGEDGLLEIKSRKQKFQFEAVVNNEVNADFMMQIQTGLLVSERPWLDFISYSGGMHMFIKRVKPDEEIQDAIIAAATAFEERLETKIKIYKKRIKGLLPTKRKIYDEEITL